MKAELELNRDDTERFLNALDPTATFFTFQTFDDDYSRKDKRLTRILHGTLERRWDLLTDLNQRGAGVFVTVNETDGEGRAAGNIERVRAVFVDLDGAPLPEAFHCKPHIIVESSPGRWHVYWRVKDCALDQFEGLQRRLLRHYGGDPKIVDTARVMRLPGFVHQKVDKHGVAVVPSVTRLDRGARP
jgi:putative DNA primase/helicase